MRLFALGPTTVEEDRDILRLSDPDRGVIVVATPPRAESLGWVAGEVLAALGKDDEIAPYGRRDGDEREWAVTWLEAHQIRNLVFVHADWLPIDLLQPLETLASEAGGEAWFLFSTRRGARAALRSVRARPRRTSAKGVADELSRIPPVELVSAIPATCAAGWQAIEQPRLEADLVQVIATIASRPDVAGGVEAAARDILKGTQWRVESAAGTPPSGERLALQLKGWKWTVLRRFRDPRQVAGCVLAALGASVVEMLELTIDDLGSDGGWVRLTGDVIVVPAAARPFIRAQLVATRRRRVSSAQALTDRNGLPTPYALRRSIAAALEEAGQFVPPLSIEYRVHPAQRLLERHGLRLVRREPQAPGGPWITRTPPPVRNGPDHPWRREAAARMAAQRRRYDFARKEANRATR